VTTINKEKYVILYTLHDDPIEREHTWITIKIKIYFKWKNMRETLQATKRNFLNTIGLTKYLITIPMPGKSAKWETKAIFELFILKYGTTTITEYKNSIINDLCKYFNIDNITSNALHHQSLGIVKRRNRIFNEYVRPYILSDKTDWDVWLIYFTLYGTKNSLDKIEPL